MSEQGNRPVVSGTALVWAIASMFIALLAACVAIVIGLPESRNPGGLVATLLGSFSSLVVSLGLLFQVGKVTQRVERTGQLVDYLANGGGDNKTEAAVHRALDVREAQQINADMPPTPPNLV